jgi:ATP-dependent DNA helicase RecQ
MFYSWADVMLHERFLDRIEDDALRARTRAATVALFNLIERPGCRHQALVKHFDEVADPCGTSCDHCTGQSVEARLEEAADLERVAMAGWRKSATTARHTSRASLDVNDLSVEDRELFDALRALRRELADETGVPAYIVFGDRVLLEMVDRKPETHSALLQVPGVGQAKLERYGDAFLEVIVNHAP